MDSEDFDIDPAIAEAMGFSGFGNQNRKRKFDSNDGFVDPNIARKPRGTGANTMPVRDRRALKPEGVEHGSGESEAPPVDGKPSLEMLRHGVRNEKGDVAYFLPSFLEDPWEGLKTK